MNNLPEEMIGNVKHNLNPVIGYLRLFLHENDFTEKVDIDSTAKVEMNVRKLQWMLERVREAKSSVGGE